MAALRESGHQASGFDLVAGRLGDIEDMGQLAGALAGHDGLVHLARAPSNSANPVVFRSNVMGTFNALEAAALTGVERVVVASLVSVLGPYLALAQRPAYLPLDENQPLTPTRTYPRPSRWWSRCVWPIPASTAC